MSLWSFDWFLIEETAYEKLLRGSSLFVTLSTSAVARYFAWQTFLNSVVSNWVLLGFLNKNGVWTIQIYAHEIFDLDCLKTKEIIQSMMVKS